MKTPVAFIIFDRPETTRRVFAAIARAKPQRLLVVADGPRNSLEALRCAEARAVIDEVNWDCEVLTNFSEVNLGCKRRVSSGLDWVFQQCEEAIIVEDDCLPDESFFPFCVELLEKFREEKRVSMICGSTFQQGKKRSADSYFFGLHVTVWGWASWRRAWRNYDVEMQRWTALRETSWLSDLLLNPVAVKYWQETFDDVVRGHFDTWDYQFFFSWWANNSLAVVPDRNLVSNIGFGPAAVRTKELLPTMANLAVETMPFPLDHPRDISVNRAADDFSFRQICPWIVENQNPYWRLRHRLTGSLPEPLRLKIRELRAKFRGQASS